MNKKLRTATLILLTGLLVLSLPSIAKSQPPLLPMTIMGYVTVQKTDGTNITAPSGLYVYAKQGLTVLNGMGSTPTDAQGHYSISVTGLADGTPIDLWVQEINVTRITFHPMSEIDETNGGNLTVIDTTLPAIQILSPQPQTTVSPTQPVRINATLTDDLAIDPTTIVMTLNQTQLTWTFDSTTGLLSSQTGPLTRGLYIANVTVSDIAGNTNTTAWNFSVGKLPTVNIMSPTTANPTYTQSGKPVQLIFNYTEPSPLNWTITILNAAYTVPSVTNTTAITPGTSTTTVNVTIPRAAPEGTYDVDVTVYNTYYLSTTATQTAAIVIDNTPPTVSITYPTESSTVNGTAVAWIVWVNGTIAETNKGTARPQINDTSFYLKAWDPTSGAFGFWNVTTIPGGSKLALTVTFTDAAQNMGSGTVTFNYIVPEFPTAAIILMMMALVTMLTLTHKKAMAKKQKT